MAATHMGQPPESHSSPLGPYCPQKWQCSPGSPGKGWLVVADHTSQHCWPSPGAGAFPLSSLLSPFHPSLSPFHPSCPVCEQMKHWGEFLRLHQPGPSAAQSSQLSVPTGTGDQHKPASYIRWPWWGSEMTHFGAGEAEGGHISLLGTGDGYGRVRVLSCSQAW